ncbi:MAG: NADPH:quinone oxidoreductase family protein [Nitratireductor sp.]|jgi:NADPH2:quinone reductase|nr:NADPH:quinone oxidoreductase family protein [Nitratireductor sp.]
MKAIVCRDYGPIDALEYAEIETPEPGPKEVVIRAEAIGVNYPDGLLVQGLYQAKPPTPFIPGMEVVGEVIAAGSEVSRFKRGDRVGATVMTGAYAQEVKAHQSAVMPVPAGADASEITALMCGFGTAHHGLKQRGQLKAGETLVVTGAAGLTGLAAVQIGKAMGAKVVAVASTDAKRKLAEEAGADISLPYEDLKEELRLSTGGDGVDVAFDVVGGDTFDTLTRSMGWGGRLLVVGFASGRIPQFPVNLALVKGYSVVGVFWGSFTQREPKIFAENMAELMGWYAEGRIKPHVEKVFALEHAAEALKFIHNRHAAGKIVLKP